MAENIKITEIITIFISLAAFVISVIVLSINKKSARIDNSRYNLSAIFDFILNEYLDKKIQPLKISENEQPIDRLKVAKMRAFESYNTNKDNWEEITKIQSERWESKVASETSISLERIGVSVYSGALPVRVLLLLAAGQILKDYIVCNCWVKSHRERENTKSINGIDYHRRYGEWLVMLSALFMNKYYPDYAPLAIVNELYGGEKELENKFIDFKKHEKENLSPITEREISRILKGSKKESKNKLQTLEEEIKSVEDTK